GPAGATITPAIGRRVLASTTRPAMRPESVSPDGAAGAACMTAAKINTSPHITAQSPPIRIAALFLQILRHDDRAQAWRFRVVRVLRGCRCLDPQVIRIVPFM